MECNKALSDLLTIINDNSVKEEEVLKIAEKNSLNITGFSMLCDELITRNIDIQTKDYTIEDDSADYVKKKRVKDDTSRSRYLLKKELDNRLIVSKLVSEINKIGLTTINNYAESGIVWVLYDKRYSQSLNEIISNDFTLHLEKRGAIATNNRSAWRIMKARRLK